jgi:hypothetical protein
MLRSESTGVQVEAATDVPVQGRQHRNLAAILCFWAIATWLAVGSALASDWPPIPQLPTAAQVDAARNAAYGAGFVAVLPLLVGLFLAGRWRAYGWAITFGVLLMFAVLGSALLVSLTHSPVRQG